VTDGAAIPLPPPRDRGSRPTDGEVQRQTTIDDPAGRLGSDGRVADSRPGRWLLLRDAVREIGSLESLYRLARDGTLPSRENAQHGIEVWIADRDLPEGAPTRPLAVPAVADAAVSSTPLPSELATQIGAVLASLTESHERGLQIARENGALSERVPALERELETARASAASHQEALDALQRRLGAVIEANLALTDLLRPPSPDSERGQTPAADRVPWPWLLLISACVAAVAIFVWLIERGHVLVP
jgi:hypothetical protein